jgi:Mg-chelatase subunit ChlD
MTSAGTGEISQPALKRHLRLRASAAALRLQNLSTKGAFTMAGKRELIEPHKGDRRFVRRDSAGRFVEVVDASRSLQQDRKQHARTISKPGYGDRGDRKR